MNLHHDQLVRVKMNAQSVRLWLKDKHADAEVKRRLRESGGVGRIRGRVLTGGFRIVVTKDRSRGLGIFLPSELEPLSGKERRV